MKFSLEITRRRGRIACLLSTNVEIANRSTRWQFRVGRTLRLVPAPKIYLATLDNGIEPPDVLRLP